MKHRDLIFKELRAHAPFTALGSLAGIVLLLGLVWSQVPAGFSHQLFGILHPLHVLLSAQATIATYRRAGGAGFWRILLIGYVGGVGIGTLSDCLIPYLGEWLLGLPNRGYHIGFIEEWWLVNPLALVGIALGVWSVRTRVPHGLHVLISTGASLFHIALAMDGTPSLPVLGGIAVFLFLSVWIPCCTSDIVFPLLFAPNKDAITGCCHHHH
ncbi:MAG TPA: hypothetical protein PLD40_01710 [Kiritimatiellia bacterium]|jgi:hypothetical protein|nr:MAG: hypothetical protein BWX54_00533 [Verrucomicrobia bacterium ADurb.Bin018]HOE00303.1 hypothetical protein [Kiritimatiellia bacterium]HOE35995.1 hypothetical protein [Kiritimatiellia bacterium]HOR73329.1 hypothetical protein [Kiritimatiellia bacterium]HOU58234.1 hypothetical protein [Kiritimatiellia bacterium]